MAVPVLVVDDSSMSRKIVIKALPAAWNIDLCEAANGEQAIKAYHEGKAHVMFLDLTMPVKDGYEVLREIQAHGLNSFVIVVSADIQPKAQQRVKTLGAMAFIKKPVHPENIADILKQYGIFG